MRRIVTQVDHQQRKKKKKKVKAIPIAQAGEVARDSQSERLAPNLTFMERMLSQREKANAKIAVQDASSAEAGGTRFKNRAEGAQLIQRLAELYGAACI